MKVKKTAFVVTKYEGNTRRHWLTFYENLLTGQKQVSIVHNKQVKFRENVRAFLFQQGQREVYVLSGCP